MNLRVCEVDGVTTITVFVKFPEWKFRAHVLLAVAFGKTTAGDEISRWRWRQRQLSRRSDPSARAHHLVNVSALPPQNTLAGLVKKLEKFSPSTGVATLYHRIAFASPPTRKFKLKIIHSTSHMGIFLGCWLREAFHLILLIPNATHYNFVTIRAGGSFCCFAFNCDGK